MAGEVQAVPGVVSRVVDDLRPGETDDIKQREPERKGNSSRPQRVAAACAKRWFLMVCSR